MTDKYEEFKEFVREKYFPNPSRWIGIFNDFEEEQAEKHNEEEIKMIISRIMYCQSYYYLSIKQQKEISKIYDELKEKDLIKWVK